MWWTLGTCVSFNSCFLGVYAQQWDCWTICFKERDDFSLSFCTSLVKIFPWYMNSPTPPDLALRLTNWVHDLSHHKSIREAERGRWRHPAWTGRLQGIPMWRLHVLTCSVTLGAASTEKVIKGLRNCQGQEDLRCCLRHIWYVFFNKYLHTFIHETQTQVYKQNHT